MQSSKQQAKLIKFLNMLKKQKAYFEIKIVDNVATIKYESLPYIKDGEAVINLKP